MEVPAWISHVESFVDPDQPASQQNHSLGILVNLLSQGSIAIQQFIKEMAAYLTSTDNAVRARGILLVADLLSSLRTTTLEDSVVHSFATFFSSKLEDWHSLHGALVGSLALLRRGKEVGAVTHTDVEILAQSALMNLEVQALAQPDRLLCLELLECLLSQHKAAVESLDDHLIHGICAAIDGEKDPRCLLLAFRLVEFLVQLFPGPNGPIASLSADLFNIIQCYFPISFNPPPNDTRGITREDLSIALMHAFASTKYFTSFCIPLLLEKLSSSLKTAKLDSLRYLGFCCLHYGSDMIKDYAGAIWSALKKELLPLSIPDLGLTTGNIGGKDGEVMENALICLTYCIRAFQGQSEGIDRQIVAGRLLQLLLEDEFLGDFFMSIPSVIVSTISNYSQNKYSENGLSVHKGVSVINESNRKGIGHVLSAAAKASCYSCFLVSEKLFQCIFKSIRIPLRMEGIDILVFLRERFLKGQLHVGGSLDLAMLDALVLIVDAARILAEDVADKFQSYSACPSHLDTSGDICVTPLKASATEVIAMLILAVTISLQGEYVTHNLPLMEEIQKLGVAGLQALASFPPTISPLCEEQFDHVLSFLLCIVGQESQTKSFWDKAVEALTAIGNAVKKFPASTHNVSFIDAVIPFLLKELLKEELTLPVQMNVKALAMIFHCMPLALVKVINGLKEIILTNLISLLESCNGDSEKTVALLQGLSHDIMPRCCDGELQNEAMLHLALDLWSVYEALPVSYVFPDFHILDSSLKTLRIVLSKCNKASQEEFILRSSNVVISRSCALLCCASMGASGTHDNGSDQNGWPVALFASAVLALMPSTAFSNKGQILNIFLKTVAGLGNPIIVNVAMEAVASMLNKWPDECGGNGNVLQVDNLILEDAVNKVLEGDWMEMNQEECSVQKNTLQEGKAYKDVNEVIAIQIKLRGVCLLSWIGKALAMRGHIKISDIATFMLSLVQCDGAYRNKSGSNACCLFQALWPKEGEESAISMAACEGFGIIMQDSKTSLNKDYHAICKPLYKQRFFNSMLPLLLEALKDRDAAERYLLCRTFGFLISGAPSVAYLNQAVEVFPLILESLSVLCKEWRDSDILLSVLLALSVILIDENSGKSVASDHVSTLVNRLTDLIHYPFSMVVRETALQSLSAVAALPYIRIFPLRTQVLRALSIALDDHKRIVRKGAIQCQHIWNAIGR